MTTLTSDTTNTTTTTKTTNTTNNKYEILCAHEYDLYKPCIVHRQYKQHREPIDKELCNIYKTLYDSCLNFKKHKFMKTTKHSM